MSAPILTVALGEYDTGWHNTELSLAAATRVATHAAAFGARVVVLPEMATTGFTMETDRAVTLDSRDVSLLRAMASRLGIWLIAGVALRETDADGTSCAHNAALAIDPMGEIVAIHRKRRMFAFAGEDASYRAGTENTVVTIDGVRFGLFVCYELRFAELFAEVAADVDAMIVIANWPAPRRAHWDALLRARAIENQCAVIGVNRTGIAGGLTYDGGSAAFDAWGDRIEPAAPGGVRIVTIDAAKVKAVRERFPFLRDRRLPRAAGSSTPELVSH
jgi:predicted amidohydrolase